MLLTRETNLYQTDAIKDGITAGASTAVSNYDQNVLNQMHIFNKLTNNGQEQGIYLQNGKLYLNFEYAVGQTLKLGGVNNSNGLLEVYNASGTKIGKWDKDGALITGNLTLDSTAVTATVGDMIEFKMYNFDRTLLRRFSGNGLRVKSKNNPKYSTYVSPDRTVCFVPNSINSLTSIISKLASDVGENLYYVENGTKLYHHITAHGDAFGMALGTYSLDSAFPNDDTEVNINFTSVFEDAVQVLIGTRGLAIGGGLINHFGSTDCYIGNSWGVSREGFASSSNRENTSYGVFIDYRRAEIILGGATNSESVFNSHILRYTTSGLVVNGNTVAYQSTSSIRYKHNIELLHNSNLDPHRLYNLKAKQFRYNLDVPLQYKDMYGMTIPGFIAEDVAEIYPSAVIHHPEHPDDIESWDERRIIPPMLSLIQEQHEQIEQLMAKVAELERKVS